MLVASDAKGDYGFLNLKGPAFDLSDRGVSGRPPVAGLDAFVYTERGVYRSGETVHVTSLLRDAQGVAATGVPLTLVIERPDGLEYRRTSVADAGVGGYSLSVPISSSASTGTWRVRAFTDPKRPAVGETTFLVEDYVPDRLEFDLAAPAGRIVRGTPTKLTVDGRYLYGAPASGLDLEGEVVVTAAKERPGLAGYKFGIADEYVETVRQPLEDLPQTDDKGKASFEASIEKLPQTTRPLEAQVIVRLAESGGRSVERKITLPVVAAGNMIGVKPLFSGRSLGEGETATFDVGMFAPDGKMLAAKGLRYELLKIESRYQYYRRDGRWEYEPIKLTRRVADGRLDVAADQAGRISAPVQWGRYRLEVSSADANGPVTVVGFDAGFYSEATADTPDLLEIALDKPEYKVGEAMTVAVTARTAGRVTINVMGDKLLHSVTQDVPAGTGRIRVNVGSDWGAGAYVVATLRRPLDARAQRMPGRAIGVQWFVDRPQGAHARARHEAAGSDPAEHEAPRAGQDRRPRLDRSGARRGRRRRRRHPQPHQLQAAGAGRLSTSASASSPPRSATSTGSSSTACRARAVRSAPAATRAATSTAARRRRRRSRSIPAWSMSAPAAPRSCSTSRPSPAPSASWRWPGARTRSAAPTATSRCATRWC